MRITARGPPENMPHSSRDTWEDGQIFNNISRKELKIDEIETFAKSFHNYDAKSLTFHEIFVPARKFS